MNRYKQLFSNTLIFAVGTFSSKLLMFLMTSYYIKMLDPAQYGMTDIMVITATFLIPIASLGIAESVTVFGLDKDNDKTKVFTNGVATVLLGMIALAALFPIINFIPMYDNYGMYLYAYVYISCFKTLCSQFVRARGLVKLYAFDGILTTVFLILLNFLFIGGFHMGVQGYLLAVILPDALSIVFLMLAAGLPKFIRFDRLDTKLWKSMLKYSIPMIPTLVLWTVISGSDRFFIKGMIGDEAQGLYTAANKIPYIISVLSAFFTQAWHMSAITEKKSGDYEKFYGNVFSSYQSLMYIATAGILLLNKPIMEFLRLWDDKMRYEDTYKYVPMLLLGILFMCMGSYLSSAYAATKKSVNSFVTSLVAAVVNIALNILLIPVWGIQGASFATLISYASCFFIRLVDTRRYVRFPVNFSSIFVNALVLSGMTALSIAEPKGMYIWLSLLFVFVMAINFKAVLRTVKKLFGR